MDCPDPCHAIGNTAVMLQENIFIGHPVYYDLDESLQLIDPFGVQCAVVHPQNIDKSFQQSVDSIQLHCFAKYKKT